MRPVVASNRMMLVANCMSKWDGKDSHSTHKMCFVLSKLMAFLGLCRHCVHRHARLHIVTVHDKSDSPDLYRHLKY